MNSVIKIATRDSALAMAQANIVAGLIENNGFKTELVPMKTTGDKVLDKGLYEIGGKGLFLKELEEALRDEKVDICVHSLKDMPVDMPDEFPLIGVTKSDDYRDVLVLPKSGQWDKSKPVGCSSLRRMMWFARIFPGVHFENIRGNINTRLRKLDDGMYGALILAAAGLKRLGMEDRISRFFEVDEILPAAGQGIIGIQGRTGADFSFLDGVINEETMIRVLAERGFTKTIGADCTAPVAANAYISGQNLKLTGWFCTEDGKEHFGTEEGLISEAADIGRRLAERILND